MGSVAGGECRVFSAAPHVILGKTQPDQDWIDGEIEAGVGACGFPRPGPRPAALDAPATRQVPAAITPPRKRKGVIRRFRERVLRSKPVDSAPPLAPMRSQAPIVLSPPAPAAAPAAVSEAPRPVTPPPPPQDPVDALLHPRK